MDATKTKWPEVMETAMDDTKAGEMLSSLFTADTLIESEYLQTHRRTQHIEPEKSLMLAVLKDAITCFLENFGASNAKRKRLSKEADAWIFEEDRVWMFSFESICGILGLDPGYIRKGLRQRERDQLIRSVTAAEPLPFSTRGTTPHKRSGTLSQRVECDPFF
jgi:hypothetical protein